MLVLIYNEDTNKIERYNRNLGDPMPYVNNKYLTLKEFKSNSSTNILWSTKKTMQAFNTTRVRFGGGIYVGYAFKRIFEGGHTSQSQHYAGTSFDVGQTWTYSKRRELYLKAKQINVWSYVEPISQTPRWVHFDKRNNNPACSSGYPLLKFGSKNTYVMLLQDALNNLYGNIAIDGIFGNSTKNAVLRFQRNSSLSIDGIVGCKTWSKLTNKLNGSGKTKYTSYYS